MLIDADELRKWIEQSNHENPFNGYRFVWTSDLLAELDRLEREAAVLKRCKCGREPYVKTHGSWVMVMVGCAWCGIEVTGKDKSEAVNKWNYGGSR